MVVWTVAGARKVLHVYEPPITRAINSRVLRLHHEGLLVHKEKSHHGSPKMVHPCRRQAEREAAAAAAVPADEPWQDRLRRLAIRAFVKACAATLPHVFVSVILFVTASARRTRHFQMFSLLQS